MVSSSTIFFYDRCLPAFFFIPDNTLTYDTHRSIASTEIYVVVIAVVVILAFGVTIISLNTSIIRDAVRKVDCNDVICIKKLLTTSNSQNMGTNQFGHPNNSQNSGTALAEKEKEIGKVCSRHRNISCEKDECSTERPLKSKECN